jgi:antitoxin component of MazEF toxin-antitoxin module
MSGHKLLAFCYTPPKAMAEKIIKTGNSAAVTLPAKFVRDLNLKVGDPVEVGIDYVKGAITFRFPGARQLPLASRSRSKT